jgi:hypothetical protein
MYVAALYGWRWCSGEIGGSLLIVSLVDYDKPSSFARVHVPPPLLACGGIYLSVQRKWVESLSTMPYLPPKHKGSNLSNKQEKTLPAIRKVEDPADAVSMLIDGGRNDSLRSGVELLIARNLLLAIEA